MKKMGWMAVALAALLIALVVALPFVASTQLVRDRIALELSAWSGYRVEIGGDPEVDVWPFFRATLRDVRFSAWNDAKRAPVITVERIETDLSALAALGGDVVFSSALLDHATLHVTRAGDGSRSIPTPEGGRLIHSVAAARAAVAANPESPDASALPTDPLGRLIFTNSRIVEVADGAETEIVSAMEATVDWATLDRGARVTARGIWGGESVTVTLAAPRALVLLGGGTSPLTLSIESAPAKLSFEGRVRSGGQRYVEGSLSFAATSMRRAMAWTGQRGGGAVPTGSLTARGTLSGNPNRLKFENAEVAFDGNPGEGILELSIGGGTVPTISGTLAFEALDLASMMSAFNPSDGGDGRSIDTIFADHVGLDLRLSASRATAGGIALADTAATIQLREGLAAFDISDATAFGGTVQAGVRFDRASGGDQAEVRLNASDIDGVAFAAATGWTSMVPAARGKVSAMLKGPASKWADIPRGLAGPVTIAFDAGQIAGFDLADFMARTRNGGFVSLAEVAKGSQPMTSLTIAATLAGGVAKIDKAELAMPDRVLALSGLVPYLDGGLALTGHLFVPKSDAPSGWASELDFFVGGAWRQPYATAIIAGPPL